ncbi:MAG: NFACT family protein [Clostridia bacterium]|nr:NFACT family protein [Clostridia bacterium]
MPMDGVMLGFITRELNAKLKDGRIDKVIQPERDEIHLLIRAQGQNQRLVMSASANSARVHLTDEIQSAPMDPPMFCMLLRKYIGGGRVQGFRQIDGDRILEMDVSSLSELGDPVIRTLVIEIMGRHSNIVLLTGGRTIIDAARHINETLSRVRQIEPGLPYERPPLQGKISMDALNAGILADRLRSADTGIARAISKTISGFSPQAAEEAAAVLGLNPDLSPDFYDVDAVARDLCAYVASLPERGPCVVLFGESGSPKDIYPFPQAHLPDAEMRRCASPSEALDLFFRERNLHERLNQHISGIAHVLKNNIERCEKKIAIQEDALRNAARMDEYKKRGELIQGNLYMIEKGAKSATVPDYYSENCEPIEIPLDEALSPAQNAQRYFKLYQKARGAQRLAAEQKQKAEDELLWLYQMEDDLRKCSDLRGVEELREMMVNAGYIRKKESKGNKRKELPSQPMRFLSSDGIEIEVGKNAIQNENLTMHAAGYETWLHAQKMPGSHVIIHAEQVPQSTLDEAAMLAAYYSKGVNSSGVPIDVTLRRYIKKPGGTPVGFVIYTHQKTLYITPDETAVRKIRCLVP